MLTHTHMHVYMVVHLRESALPALTSHIEFNFSFSKGVTPMKKCPFETMEIPSDVLLGRYRYTR